MESILVVSNSEKSKDILKCIIEESGTYHVEIVSNSEECKKLMSNSIFDLILINTTLNHESEEQFSIFLDENTNSSLILIVNNSISEKISKQVEERGILVVKKPINKFMLINTINISIIYRRKLQKYINENENLKNKIKDIKLIDRAKYTLMEYLRMSESEAHKYIEKQAMDLRIKKVEVCKNILKMYEF